MGQKLTSDSPAKGSLSEGDGNENGNKPVGLDWENNTFARVSRLFCTLLSRRCKTTTRKSLISRFVEDGKTKQQFSFSFREL